MRSNLYFKGYGRLLSRIHREPLDMAAGKAIKGFMDIVQDCLDDVEFCQILTKG